MPKEVFKNKAGDEHIEVRWYNPMRFNDDGTETEILEPVVAVGVGQKKDFSLGGEAYKTMYFNLDSREQVDALIKTLHKVKRKVFS